MRVMGESMAPTLKSHEVVFVNHQAYGVRSPRREELVVARPTSYNGRAIVKRLVGLPHERVDMQGCSWQLGDNQFFLLGDQPDTSVDSRHFGPVTGQELVGPVQLRLWPWRALRTQRREMS